MAGRSAGLRMAVPLVAEGQVDPQVLLFGEPPLLDIPYAVKHLELDPSVLRPAAAMSWHAASMIAGSWMASIG